MMKILQETASSQTLKVIPRSYPTLVDVVITNEDTKVSTTYEDLTASSNLGYLVMDEVWDLKENKFYSFEVWDLDAGEQNEIIYKGKIFCTNQENYSINNGEYTERTRDNTYKFYGQ